MNISTDVGGIQVASDDQLVVSLHDAAGGISNGWRNGFEPDWALARRRRHFAKETLKNIEGNVFAPE